VPDLLPTTVIVRSGAPLTAKIDDEVVMLDTRQSSYFGLDATGSAIWELLDEPRAVEELCAQLVERYEVDADTCLRDVLPFLDELVGAGLLETWRTAR
jgi:hypothetical protein